MKSKFLSLLVPITLLAACTLEDNNSAGITVTGNTGSIAGNITWADTTWSNKINIDGSTLNKSSSSESMTVDYLWVVLQDSAKAALDSLHPSSTGAYLFDSLAAGTYYLTVRAEGIIYLSTTVTISSGEHRVVDLSVQYYAANSSNSINSSSSINLINYSSTTVAGDAIWNPNISNVNLSRILFPTDTEAGYWYQFNDGVNGLNSTVTPAPGELIIAKNDSGYYISIDVTLADTTTAYAGFGFLWSPIDAAVDLTEHEGLCLAYTSNAEIFLVLKQSLNSAEQYRLSLPASTSSETQCFTFTSAALPIWSTIDMALTLDSQYGVEFLFNHESIPYSQGTAHFELRGLFFAETSILK